jgi:membrane protease YdiL (CAAX protease family)
VTRPLAVAEPERPFWGFAELFLAGAVFLAALAGTISAGARYLHVQPESGLWSVLEEMTAYAILFLALKAMFARYGRGLLESLGWKDSPFSPLTLLAIGMGLSVFVVLLQYALLTPDVETPFDRLLEDPLSRVAVALFGISLGPMVEELLFRGFLQPVLVSAMGVFPGILLTSVMFGALHLSQNAFVWQSGALIMFVGFVLGVIRHLSGSTKASTIVHIAYNSLPFIALAISGNPIGKK